MNPFEEYSKLMQKRVRKILLVCNNYDNFALEEDGHLDSQISSEYTGLGLSNPPSVERVETPGEAIKKLKAGSYQLVITMYNLGDASVFDFAKEIKSMHPGLPVVMLLSFSSGIYRKVTSLPHPDIDYIFCWNNSTDLIIAIIKLLEDSMNAESDMIGVGVRGILLVEDSVRYYSTYLPLLYNMILTQNQEVSQDTLNEEQRNLRMRTRPKILMARCYDDAVATYEKYKDNILGIITDVGFVMHRGDRPEDEVADAGVRFCQLVKKSNPTMPILMQSSQESMREKAKELGIGFVQKTSKTLTRDLSEYISREFGFGDFVVTDPDTGEETGRARNLSEIEKLFEHISPRGLRKMAEKNYVSRWFYGRGLFHVADAFRPLHIATDEEAAKVRDINRRMIHDYRMNLGLGVVAEFDPDTYNDSVRFARLGKGSMGGKARGLAFLNNILQKYDLYDKWKGVRVLVPRTLVITTDYFDRFITENGLKYVINSDLTDAEILSEFTASAIPQDLKESLRKFIRVVRRPLAIRSSSLLEDSYYQPFAGVYSTYMVPRTGNEEQELRLISKAIKSVYASMYFGAARRYILSTSNVISEEKMSIVIQEICGSEDHGYWFPTLSGVARSVNFYPIGHETPEDGVAKVAFGMGKAVVDGEQVLRFSPRYPHHILQTSTAVHATRDTQQVMYAMSMDPERFKTSPDDSVNFDRIPISDCGKFRNLAKVCSTWDMQSQMLVDTPFAEGPKYITFAHILQYGTFPLASILCRLLEIAQNEVRCPVEIEFAADLDTGDKEAHFNVLQIRPISAEGLGGDVDWKNVDTNEPLISSSCAIGPGTISGVRDFVYLKREAFDVLKTREMAAEIMKINSRLLQEGRGYVLVGFGRWGSSVPSLGVPVQWSDISAAKVIVECCLEKFIVDPSQGTHFFQNMTSFGAGYVNVNPFDRRGDVFDSKVLDAMPAWHDGTYFRCISFPEDLTVIVDGRSNRALIR